jgi:hypothetical protein
LTLEYQEKQKELRQIKQIEMINNHIFNLEIFNEIDCEIFYEIQMFLFRHSIFFNLCIENIYVKKGSFKGAKNMKTIARFFLQTTC